MSRTLIRIGRTFVALALIGLGVEHVLFGEFVTARAPAWPDALPGGAVWAYATGVIIVFAALAILAGRQGRAAAAILALLIGAWALLRHPLVLVEDTFLSAAWTQAGKALVLTSGLLTVAATLPTAILPMSSVMSFLNRSGEFITAGRLCLGLFMCLTGVQHFLFTEFVALLIPAWFPGDAVFWTYFAGVALVCGGVGLLIRRVAGLAALLSGVMVFSWFWIIHVPRTLVGISDSIAVFEALAVSGIAFVIAGTHPDSGAAWLIARRRGAASASMEADNLRPGGRAQGSPSHTSLIEEP